MPHAVINISLSSQSAFDLGGFCCVRAAFGELARQCIGDSVVLYQSGRSSDKPESGIGYFAKAIVGNVYKRPDDDDGCVIELVNVVALPVPTPMFAQGVVLETALLTLAGNLAGWSAAQDVRLLTVDEFGAIVPEGFRDPQSPAAVPPTGERPAEGETPLFRDRSFRVRDPKFAKDVYRAYHGRCAISGVSLLNPDRNECGLEAAHVYPYRLEPRNSVQSGMLFAPSWHCRYDAGLITIHDDYTWSARVEDADTAAIVVRVLRLPLSAADLPDIGLIRRNRARLGLD